VTFWCKIGLIAAFLAIYGWVIWHTKGQYDQAAQEAVLAEQIQDAAKKQTAIEALAKATESDLLTERQKTAMLTKQMGAARASKNHTNCKLDVTTIGLLKDATSPAHHISR